MMTLMTVLSVWSALRTPIILIHLMINLFIVAAVVYKVKCWREPSKVSCVAETDNDGQINFPLKRKRKYRGRRHPKHALTTAYSPVIWESGHQMVLPL